jgi:hypothetical protein
VLEEQTWSTKRQIEREKTVTLNLPIRFVFEVVPIFETGV